MSFGKSSHDIAWEVRRILRRNDALSDDVVDAIAKAVGEAVDANNKAMEREFKRAISDLSSQIRRLESQRR